MTSRFKIIFLVQCAFIMAGVSFAAAPTPDSIHVMVANVADSPAKIVLDLMRVTGHDTGDGKILYEDSASRFTNGRLNETLAPGQSRVYRFERKGFRP